MCVCVCVCLCVCVCARARLSLSLCVCIYAQRHAVYLIGFGDIASSLSKVRRMIRTPRDGIYYYIHHKW